MPADRGTVGPCLSWINWPAQTAAGVLCVVFVPACAADSMQCSAACSGQLQPVQQSHPAAAGRHQQPVVGTTALAGSTRQASTPAGDCDLSSVVLFLVLQVLWNVENGEAICGSPTGADFTLALRFYQHDSTKLVSAASVHLLACR